HPTSCCSVAEIMSVLFFHTMKYRPEDPRNPNNDRFILSKGHAAPVLYAVWAEVGYLKENELLNLRKVDSILEGHPVPVSYRVFCLLGDGELSEGAVWEAMAFASFYQLDNLVAILDINRLGQSDPTPLQHHVEKYQRRCEAFGLTPQDSSLKNITVFSCLSAAEDKMGWHGKPVPKDMSDVVIRELQSRTISCNKRLYPAPPNEDTSSVSLRNIRMPSAPNYKPGDKVSVAIGCAVRDRNVVFASTFATFFTRAYDQLRMAAISESNINLCGSHCGVSIERINVRVIDPFTIKPLDSKTIIDSTRATRGRIVTVEDHYYEGEK
ncbi:hypothetical protein GOODEAATRI_010544, partial [Goodea atripinnis]